jgi:ligand-binding SRPBCC domain-containing protein
MPSPAQLYCRKFVYRFRRVILPAFYTEKEVMAFHAFKQVQFLPLTLTQAWDFFSNPANLAQITPPEMQFVVTSKYHGPRMYAGQIITYRVSPLPLLRLSWMTEITQVKEGEYFIDEQRFGPYDLWHHQHHFKEVEGGVEMTDIVHYKLPWYMGGSLSNALFVRKKLEGIFDFRRKKVEELFGG